MVEEKQVSKEEQIRKLKTWLAPKEVVLREAQKSIETQSFYTKQLKEDLESGFLIKQKKKEISEQMTDGAKKLKELELELLEKEIEMNYQIRQADIVMESLKVAELMGTNAIKDINKKITQLERNHKVEIKPDSEIKTKQDAEEVANRRLEENK